MKIPRYSGPNRTGMCVCGHAWHSHHLGLIVHQSIIDEIGEYYVPGACLHYGCNELEGLDSEGNDHCFRYIDQKEWETLKSNSQKGM